MIIRFFKSRDAEMMAGKVNLVEIDLLRDGEDTICRSSRPIGGQGGLIRLLWLPSPCRQFRRLFCLSDSALRGAAADRRAVASRRSGRPDRLTGCFQSLLRHGIISTTCPVQRGHARAATHRATSEMDGRTVGSTMICFRLEPAGQCSFEQSGKKRGEWGDVGD